MKTYMKSLERGILLKRQWQWFNADSPQKVAFETHRLYKQPKVQKDNKRVANSD